MIATQIRTAERTIDSLLPEDWPEVRAIYLEGIFSGNSTFQTEAPSWEEWDSGHLSIGRLVSRSLEGVLGWAALSSVSPRLCYAGVAEISVYVASKAQKQGIGRTLLREAIRVSEVNGIWTLQGTIFPENVASLNMCLACGFRQIGRRKHVAKLNGLWRDTILVERRSAVVGVG